MAKKKQPDNPAMQMQGRVFSPEGTYTGVLGEEPGLCQCAEPERWPVTSPHSTLVRTCYKCKRWMGPAHYPEWFGEHPPAVMPEKVRCR